MNHIDRLQLRMMIAVGTLQANYLLLRISEKTKENSNTCSLFKQFFKQLSKQSRIDEQAKI